MKIKSKNELRAELPACFAQDAAAVEGVIGAVANKLTDMDRDPLVRADSIQFWFEQLQVSNEKRAAIAAMFVESLVQLARHRQARRQ